jgi:hypothetical protein
VVVLVLFVLLDLIAAAILAFGMRAPFFYTYHIPNFFSALAVGQMSVVAIWLATRRRHDIVSVLIPAIALAATTYLRSKLNFFGADFTLLDYAFRSALQALAALIPIAVLVRTPLWRWVSRGKHSLPLRFSFVHLFFWTTCVAVFMTLLRQATWASGAPLAVVMWLGVFAPAVVAVAVLLVRQIRWIGLSRIILNMLIGAEVGILLATFGNRQLMSQISTEFVVQAILITIAIEIGRYGDFVTADAELTQNGGACRDITRG